MRKCCHPPSRNFVPNIFWRPKGKSENKDIIRANHACNCWISHTNNIHELASSSLFYLFCVVRSSTGTYRAISKCKSFMCFRVNGENVFLAIGQTTGRDNRLPLAPSSCQSKLIEYDFFYVGKKLTANSLVSRSGRKWIDMRSILPKQNRMPALLWQLAIKLFFFRLRAPASFDAHFVCSFLIVRCGNVPSNFNWKSCTMRAGHRESAKQANDQSNFRRFGHCENCHSYHSFSRFNRGDWLLLSLWSMLAFGTRIVSVIRFEFLRSWFVWCGPNWPTIFTAAAVPPSISTNVDAEIDANKQQNTQIQNLWESIRCEFTVK